MNVNTLWPLTVAASPSSSKDTKIRCCDCMQPARYGDAVDHGWQYDPIGIPFTAYFCPLCARRFEALQHRYGNDNETSQEMGT